MTTSPTLGAERATDIAARPRAGARLDVAAPLRGLLHGRPGDPRWARPCLLLLLAATAVLYLWNLGASGWANAFYSMAAQADAESWKALFFGSLDPGNALTVDKPPVALWVMGLSARLFGVNSWALLAPQAVMGVATVALVHATVRRQFSAGAALLAGTALALTPVAALMFRFNNPDALLVLLLTAAAYCLVRALESTRTSWLVAAAALVGTGFLTKMLQSFLVLPAFVLVYLVVADTPVRRRVLQLLLAAGTLVVASGWWVAVVELWPPSSRPYIGGSQTNSALELALGYNGLGRITGNETGSVGGAPAGGGGRWGTPGLLRMFNAEYGGQIAWLLPAALILLVALLVLSRRAGRTNLQRAQVAMWGGWLVVTGLTFSLMAGIVHTYYTVALVPAVAALVGIGTAELWRLRRLLLARLPLAATLAVTALWSWALLGRSTDWHPTLRVAVLVLGLMSAGALLALPWLDRRLTLIVATAALVAGLAGPAAYTLQTVTTPHTGSLPTAGPSTGSRFGPVRGGFPGQPPTGGFGGPPTTSMPNIATTPGGPTGPSTGAGGLLDAGTPSTAVVQALRTGTADYTWAAATVGANNAAGYALGTGESVLAIGGFNGSDPAPTLAQFQQWVAQGRIHYFIASGGGMAGGPGGGGLGGSGTAAQITSWVQSHYTATTVDGTTLYDLTPKGSTS